LEGPYSYVGNNSAVGKLLGLLPLPQYLEHNHFKLLTTGDQRGIEWILDEAENATYSTSELNRTALLIFALVDNLEDFYITTRDPFGGGSELHYDRQWADKQVGRDVCDYAESSEKLQKLIGVSTESAYKNELLAGYLFIEGNTLYLDAVEIIEREDKDRIAELGLIEKNDYPSGYHIHNPIAETVSFELTDDTIYTFTDFNLLYVKEADGKRIYTTTKKEEFLKASSYQNVSMEEQKIPYFLEVNDGKVISITEEFIYTQ